MKLIEFDGKHLLSEASIVVPAGVFVSFNAEVSNNTTPSFPCYIKSQVLQGGRGKRGWIRRCGSNEDFERNIVELREELRDIPCAGFLCEPEVIHREEWLVSLTIDRLSGEICVNSSKEGGMNVSDLVSSVVSSPEDIRAMTLPYQVREVLVKMFESFRKNDAVSMEINPLAIKDDETAVALDAKIELDDSASFRHPEWSSFSVLPERGRKLTERELAYEGFLTSAGYRGTLGKYVELDGDIALVLSGGGASLVAMDALARAGGHPANYVEMSGNPDPEQVFFASKIVLSKPGIRAVWIAGSFANFTDIQLTVNGVLRAVDELGLRVPIVIRRDGPNAHAAKEDAEHWAKEKNIQLRFDNADVSLDESAGAVVALAATV
jgi:succinyl-CoA synthetase beta subunit